MEPKTATIDTSEAFELDKHARHLVGLFSQARVKIGLELAKTLHKIERTKLYLKLDQQAYPNFKRYLDSLDISYASAREIVGVYKTFVLVAGKTIDELAEISYHKLHILKPVLFKKEEGQYQLAVAEKEFDGWLSDTDLSQEDLSQKIREERIGPHKHKFIHLRKCTLCKLTERTDGNT